MMTPVFTYHPQPTVQSKVYLARISVITQSARSLTVCIERNTYPAMIREFGIDQETPGQ